VILVRDERHALEVANDTTYGLLGSSRGTRRPSSSPRPRGRHGPCRRRLGRRRGAVPVRWLGRAARAGGGRHSVETLTELKWVTIQKEEDLPIRLTATGGAGPLLRPGAARLQHLGATIWRQQPGSPLHSTGGEGRGGPPEMTRRTTRGAPGNRAGVRAVHLGLLLCAGGRADRLGRPAQRRSAGRQHRRVARHRPAHGRGACGPSSASPPTRHCR
jgi:hypothetical protein